MELWQKVVYKALQNPIVTCDVGDNGETYQDLEQCRDWQTIVEAVEATDSPVVTFYAGGRSRGYMLVLVGYDDESIMDYSVSDWMENLMRIKDNISECYQCNEPALELNENSRCIRCLSKSLEFNRNDNDELRRRLNGG